MYKDVGMGKKLTLYIPGLSTQPLPIHLIQIVTLENGTAHYALAGRSFHDEAHAAEEDVPVRLDSGCIAGFVDGELRTLRSVLHIASSDFPVLIVGAGGEVVGVD